MGSRKKLKIVKKKKEQDKGRYIFLNTTEKCRLKIISWRHAFDSV